MEQHLNTLEFMARKWLYLIELETTLKLIIEQFAAVDVPNQVRTNSIVRAFGVISNGYSATPGSKCIISGASSNVGTDLSVTYHNYVYAKRSSTDEIGLFFVGCHIFYDMDKQVRILSLPKDNSTNDPGQLISQCPSAVPVNN